MAHEIVTPNECAHHVQADDHLLYQNTPLLKKLLQISYEGYAKQASFETQAFIVSTREMVSDCIEPICRQNPYLSTDYLTYLYIFDQHNRGDFIQYPDVLDEIVFAMTQLVQIAIAHFRILDYPRGYDKFLDLLERIFRNDSIIQQNQHRSVIILMAQLKQRP